MLLRCYIVSFYLQSDVPKVVRRHIFSQIWMRIFYINHNMYLTLIQLTLSFPQDDHVSISLPMQKGEDSLAILQNIANRFMANQGQNSRYLHKNIGPDYCQLVWTEFQLKTFSMYVLFILSKLSKNPENCSFIYKSMYSQAEPCSPWKGLVPRYRGDSGS